jgi:hypothetical protein
MTSMSREGNLIGTDIYFSGNLTFIWKKILVETQLTTNNAKQIRLIELD